MSTLSSKGTITLQRGASHVPPRSYCRSDARGQTVRLHFGGPLLIRRAGEKEAFVLLMLCTLDMLTTLWWVINGHATEANPLLAWTFEWHPSVFVLVKGASFLPAIFFVTRYAREHRSLAVGLLRAAIFVYIALYALNVR